VKVSAVVVSHGHAGELGVLLPVLAPQVDEVLVVANVAGSVADVPHGVRVLENPRPLRLAENVNLGVASTSGEYVLAVNPDAIPEPGAVGVLVSFADAHPRCGIAAPQIGAPVRMVYVEMDKPWALINPEIVDIGNEDFEVWDDCFSFPNLLVRVSRAHNIRVRYQDLKGEWTEVDLEGDRAELLQHEIDHLDGVLAVDRPQGLDPFCLREEWHRLHGPGGRYGPPEPRSETYANQLVDG